MDNLPAFLSNPLSQPLFVLGTVFILAVYFFPGGLTAIGGRVRRWFAARRRPRRPEIAVGTTLTGSVRLDQPVVVRIDDGLGAVAQHQLGQQPGHVRLHRGLAGSYNRAAISAFDRPRASWSSTSRSRW